MARNPDIFVDANGLQCRAIKKNGQRCMNWAAPGHKVCWKHGVGGVDSPHRKYKLPSETLQTSLDKMMSDPDRLDLAEELALQRLCLQETLNKCEKLGSKEIPAVTTLVESVSEVALRMARIEKEMKLSVNPEQLAVIGKQLMAIVARHVTDEKILADIQDEIDRIAIPDGRVIEYEHD